MLIICRKVPIRQHILQYCKRNNNGTTTAAVKIVLLRSECTESAKVSGNQPAKQSTAAFVSSQEMGGRNRGSGGRFSGGGPYMGGYNNNNYNGNGMNFGNMGNMGNDLMQLMSAMASNLNMNPPPPPPARVPCGELRAHHAGMLVELTGKLIKKRVNRFCELRDRYNGATQLVIMEDKYPRLARRMYNMPENTLLTVIGIVNRRPINSCNQTMPTGEVEVEVQEIANIEFPGNIKRIGNKRTYSTMSSQHDCAITSTEYKMAKNENILKYFENRDLTCNDLRKDDIGKTVSLVGWIPPTKNNKFLQLKDGYGYTQIIIEDQNLQDTCLSAPEQVLQITGKVLARPRVNVNAKYDTGEIEVLVDNVKILNPDEPYDGPIKVKEKVQKMSIDDLENNGKEDHDGTKNGDDSAANEDGTKEGEKVKVADTNKFTDRTHNCGELTSANVGENVVVCGWLEYQRMGKFIILRDGYGQTQIFLTGKTEIPPDLTLESILQVEGTVIPRPSSTINPKIKTGHIEIEAKKVKLVNAAKKNLPFEVRRFNRAGERLRLTHRYLDLRFSDMQTNLRIRSQVLMRMREYLINYLGFVDVETPTLFRSTPGGAQEFIVPTRKPGHFYSLVQSPQQFKQMLMAGAIDRYFQIARCYRDEATRPDRQPEFTQLDIELSFTTRDDILNLVEELLRYSWPKDYPKVATPFKRMTYKEALEKYGTDKPDTRFGLLLNNVTDIISEKEELTEKYKNLAAYAIVARGQEAFWNNNARKHYESLSKEFEGTLFVRKFVQYKDVLDRLSNLLTTEIAKKLIEKLDLEEHDLIFLGIGEKPNVLSLMSRIRLDYNQFLLENAKVKKCYENKFVWVVDFPMFEKNSKTGEFESVHHPFTAPHPDDLERFNNAKSDELEIVRSQAYDLVLNGQEIGGGSIRIHDRDMQQFVLEQILKIPHEHLEHLLKALESGCPPHGGIALGIDRLMAIICRARSIRDVIAFPKSLNGRDPLSNAPVPISEEEKKLYHIAVLEEEENAESTTAHPQEDDDPDASRSSPSPPPPSNINESVDAKSDVHDTKSETQDAKSDAQDEKCETQDDQSESHEAKIQVPMEVEAQTTAVDKESSVEESPSKIAKRVIKKRN